MAHIIALLVAFKTDLTTSIWSVPVTNVDDIFCFNDVVALGAMSAILDTGVCIPEDVTLGGRESRLLGFRLGSVVNG